jgi:hypothetical protein
MISNHAMPEILHVLFMTGNYDPAYDRTIIDAVQQRAHKSASTLSVMPTTLFFESLFEYSAL